MRRPRTSRSTLGRKSRAGARVASQCWSVNSTHTDARTGVNDPELAELVRRLRAGELAEGPPPTDLRPPEPGDVVPLPASGTPLHAECLAAGNAALATGAFASVVVAGGAATRFGGSVKG